MGRFAVGPRLGVGGMGEVYRAEDTKLKRPVALKRVSPALRADERSRQRFLKEAERASALSHQHIAAVYDVLEEKGELYLVMEYVEGVTLRQRLQQPLGQGEFVEIAVQCAEALVAAHDKNIVHRDIKPENIMLTASGAVKILDFGVARQIPRADAGGTTETSSSSTGISGTTAYMAPEVLLEKEPDGRADIFSLGVVFYEMLARQHPFRAPSFMATCDRILHEVPPPVCQVNPEVPAALDHIVGTMLAKEPSGRYPSAKELLADLRAVQLGRPRVVAALARRAPTTWRRAVRLTAAAMGVVAGVALAFLLWKPAPRPFAERGWVLVGSLENRTGQAVFEHTLQEALTITLEQSRHLNVFPRSQLQQTLQRMRRDAVQEINEELGREICQRENLQGVVLGSVSQIGEDYVIVLRAVDPQGRVLFSGQETARGQKTVLPSLDRLADRLREQLGESLEAIQKDRQSLERVTSASVEAIHYFSEGKRHFYADNDREALALLQRAVELDPEFAMAYEYLALTHFFSFEFLEARRNLERAVALSDHLPERERRKILGDYYFLIVGDLAQAIDHYRVLLDLYPDDHAARRNLSLAYAQAGQLERAIPEREATLRHADSPTGRSTLALFFAMAGQIDRAIQIEEANLVAYPEAKRPRYYLGLYYLLKGEAARAEAQFRDLAKAGGAEASQAYLGLADLHASLGRYGLALEELGIALRLKREAGNVPGEVRTRLQLAAVFLDLDDRQRARQEAQRAVKLTDDPELLALAGSMLAQAGDSAASRAVWRKVEAAQPGPWALLAKVETLIAEKNAAAAIQVLEKQGSYPARPLLQEAEARTYQAAGELARAAATYERILQRPGARAAASTDEPCFRRVVQTYYRLGVLYDKLGNTTQAKKNLERFLEYYRDADAQAPFVSDARTRLERLAATQPK